MRTINLLDCTLRDGGYINNWHFGQKTITDILDKLAQSRVEYIECGYLSEKKGGNEDYTQYKDFEAIRKIVPKGFSSKKLAVMIDFGQYDIEHIADADETSPIIRVCFHKKDMEGALLYCGQLMEKGYTVFAQPMTSPNYSDVEFVELINRVNALHPAGFYIVDSFGVVEIDVFQRLLSLADHNLAPDILLGYHAHNNLQQAYGNAKYMVEQKLNHDILIDASVYGMGRGAGNLNMELFASFLNKNYDKNYTIDAFLDIMDEHLKPIFSERYWGYSLPSYLSAQYNCHPNYAGYFADKNTLTNKSMRQLLASLPADVKTRYSPSLAEEYYQLFQRHNIDDSEAVGSLKNTIADRPVLILAPGKTLSTYGETIDRFISENNPVIFAINVIPENYNCDFVFCTNEKRIAALTDSDKCRLIITSNIEESVRGIRINYTSYLISSDVIADNPTLMLIKLFTEMGIKKVNIAGFDGYNPVSSENYYNENLALGTSISVKLNKNSLIAKAVSGLGERIELNFLTPSLYR